MQDKQHFTIVCHRKDTLYNFEAIFTDEQGNIEITGLPHELAGSTTNQVRDIFFGGRHINVKYHDAHLSLRVVGYDFRGIAYNIRGIEFS
jgi:hypothetical protein